MYFIPIYKFLQKNSKFCIYLSYNKKEIEVNQLITPVTFCAENRQPQKNYKDPLKNPFLVAASYSNEVGTAISEIAPKLGTALWIPALMYLGADIYDKYKNDKNKFDPSAKRAFERTVYQGVFSFALLPACIFCAQNAVSPIGRLTKDRISTNARDAVFRHTKEVLTQCEGENFENSEKFKQVLEKSLRNKINAYRLERKSTNFFKRIFKYNTVKFSLTTNNGEKIIAFAKKNADKMFKIKNALLNEDYDNVPQSIRKKYQKSLPQIKTIYEDINANSVMKTALKSYQNINIIQNKIFKTVGGFMTIIFLSKPLSNFVEKVLVKKYLDQGIDEITHGFVHNTKLKSVFNELDKKNTEKAQNEKQTTQAAFSK